MGRVKAIHREMRVPQGEGKANKRGSSHRQAPASLHCCKTTRDKRPDVAPRLGF